MQVLRWSAAAALAAMVAVVPSYANDELSTMKASMDNMKVEMEAMRSQLAAEREALRTNAGGAPEALQSAKGNATIRIGGDVRFQYQIGWGAGYNRTNYVAWGEGARGPLNDWSNYRSTKAGWDVARAELDFDIDLSCDTKGFVSLRFDNRGSYGDFMDNNVNILDNAWWQWSNIGGSALSLKVGLQDMPFGMTYNTDMGGYDFDGVNRPLITDPFVRNVGYGNQGLIGRLPFDMDDANVDNVTNLGVVASYKFDDQLTLKAGVMAGGINNETLTGHPSWHNSLTYDNQIRNIGFLDHVIAIGWNPCWIEGLHLEASYMGTYDAAMGGQVYKTQPGGPYMHPYYVDNNPYRYNYAAHWDAGTLFWNHQGDHAYRPSFDLGAVYKINCQWTAYAEAQMTWNPYYGDGYAMALTAGVDYRMTDKLMFGLGFDWMHTSYTGDFLISNVDVSPHDIIDESPTYSNLYRISLGAKYDFGNGLYFQAQYYHDLCYMAGVGDQDTKDADTILFQTGYQF